MKSTLIAANALPLPRILHSFDGEENLQLSGGGGEGVLKFLCG